jgi:ankyrin
VLGLAFSISIMSVSMTAAALQLADIVPPASKTDTQLLAALRSADITEVKRLVALGANVNARGATGSRPLHIAVAQGAEFVSALIQAGADPDRADAIEERRPLHLAAEVSDDPRVIEMLLKAGATIDARTKKGLTPLHFSALNGNQRISEVLVAIGADVNASSQEGFTPVYLAASKGNSGLVRSLIRSGARIDAITRHGFAAIHAAVNSKSLDTVEILLRAGADPNVIPSNGETPLMSAASESQSGILKLLLEHNADVNGSASTGITALHIAAREATPETVSVLLEAGADPNRIAHDGATPLHFALRPHEVWTSTPDRRIERRVEINSRVTPILLDSGASIKARDSRSETPLHLAAAALEVGIVEDFIRRGAEVSAKTKKGETPLHYAARANPRCECQ